MLTKNVHIGEVKIGKPGSVLQAILGSCLGIAILWHEKQIYGLAHCLLPKANENTFIIGARYVSQAIPSLLALMKIHEEDLVNIHVVLAGGGNMTNPNAKNDDRLIGTDNYNTAKDILAIKGLRIIDEKVGGELGRKIRVFCDNGKYEIDDIPRIIKI